MQLTELPSTSPAISRNGNYMIPAESDRIGNRDLGLFALNASPCRLVGLQRPSKETLSCGGVSAAERLEKLKKLHGLVLP
jgi:hypothetical protein